MRTLFAFLLLSSVAFAQAPQERAEQDRRITEHNEAVRRKLVEEQHQSELFDKQIEVETLRSQIATPQKATTQQLSTLPPKTEGTLRLQFNGKWLDFPIEFVPKDIAVPPPVDPPVDPPPVDPPVDPPVGPVPPGEDVFSEQRARMKSLLAQKHPWAVYAETHVKTWGKDSVFAEAYWLMSGSQEAANALFDQGFYPGIEPTQVRYIHGLPRLALHFWDLRRAGMLTATQLALGERRLKEYAEHMILPGAIRLGDSDEVVYAICHLAMTDVVLGTDYMNHPLVGGWSHDPAKDDWANMRQQLHYYCTVLGKGGAGADSSSMYNKQTFGSLPETYHALLKLRGKDDWPEVATFNAEAAVFEDMQIFPSYNEERSWGDNQAPWSVWNIYKSGMLAAVGNHRAVQRIYEANGIRSSLDIPWRGWYFLQPNNSQGPILPFTHYAAGQGILISRDQDTQFFTQYAPYPVGIDHYHQMTQGNWTLWHRGIPAIGYRVYYGINPGGMNEMIMAGTDGFSKKHPITTYGDGKTWAAISGGDYGHPVNEYGSDANVAGVPEVVKSRVRQQVFVEGESPFVVLHDKFTVLDPAKQPSIWKVNAYHNWTWQNWHPTASPAANQVIIPVPHNVWYEWDNGYWMLWSAESYLGESPKLARVTKIEPWSEDATQTLVTFDNSNGSPVATDFIGFKGGGTFARVMKAAEVAKHQIYVRPDAELQSNGTCVFPVGDYQVTISHHGTPAEFRLVDSGEFTHPDEKGKFPQRWEAFIPFNDQSEHSADWYTVIQTSNPPLPVTLQGSTITVGGKSVTFGSSDAIGVN